MFTGMASSPEIIIITGMQSESGAKYALEFGVFDYLEKPLDLNEVRLVSTRALEFRSYRTRRTDVRLFQREGIVGHNPQLEQCLETTAKAAAWDSNVLITGETGTGKDLIAKAVHDNSRRAKAGFIIVDCAALKSSLMEGILFGHVKGAYTGADSNQDGRVALAHKGTLFLDEIGELDLEAQKRFLRLLGSKTFYPLGAKKPVKSDFRLVCATNRNLEQEIERGNFRSDLYFRIRGQCIHLPPLRRRKEDIRELTFHSMETICRRLQINAKRIYPEFLDALTAYDWPGNIRELINILDETIVTYPEDPVLHPRHLPAYLRIALHSKTAEQENVPVLENPFLQNIPLQKSLPLWKQIRQEMLDSLEKTYFQELFFRTGGRVKEMARLSGLTQARIYDLLKKHPAAFSS